MDRSDLKNGMNKNEVLDTEDGKISKLLGALPRVEAPANFEFGVKAKIANGYVRPSGSFFPFLKVAAPLGVLLLVTAFVIFYGAMPGNKEIASIPVALPIESTGSKFVPQDVPPAPAQVSGPQIEEPVRANVATMTSASRRSGSNPIRRVDRVEPAAAPREGSFDVSVRPANVITPPGFESTLGRNPNQNSNIDSPSDIPVREILGMLGMKADFAKDGWVVRSTTDNSIAMRSGVRSNDVIEAIDDQRLSETTKLKGGFEGKTLTVRREGKSVKLNLKN